METAQYLNASFDIGTKNAAPWMTEVTCWKQNSVGGVAG